MLPLVIRDANAVTVSLQVVLRTQATDYKARDRSSQLVLSGPGFVFYGQIQILSPWLLFHYTWFIGLLIFKHVINSR
jgi:hypothetical protein